MTIYFNLEDNMEIRLIEPSDAEQFENFYEKLLKETDYLIPTREETAKREGKEEDFIKKYDDYKQVFVAVDDDKIVGYLGISRSHLSKIKHAAKLTVGVLESHRRQGIATKLIEFAEKWAEDKGISRLEMTVVTNNEPAVELFEKTGFEKEGTRKNAVNLDNEFYDEFLMAKVI